MRSSFLLFSATLAIVQVAAAPHTTPASELLARDDACDTSESAVSSQKITDIEVKAIAGGAGACGFTYDTNTDSGVCVSAGWVGDANQNRCNSHIKASYNGNEVTAKIVDTCLGDPGSPFTCNDVWFTVNAFKQLASDSEYAQGHLDGAVTWSFV